MNLKNRKGFALPAVALLALAFFVFVFVLPAQFGSIVSQPAKLQLANGQYYWTATYAVDAVDATFFVTAQKETLEGGKTLTPLVDSFKVTYAPKAAYCDASLSRVRTLIGGSGGVYDFYQAGSPAKFLTFDVTAEKKGIKTTKTLSGSDLNSNAVFQDPDGKGSVVVTGLGYLSGKYDCGSFSDVALIRTNSSITGSIVSRSALLAALTSYDTGLAACGYSNAVCRLQVYVAFVNQMVRLPKPAGIDLRSNYFDFDKLLFRNNLPTILSGSSLITITADAAYYDAVLFSPQEVTRPLLTLDKVLVDVKSSQTTSLTATVKNTGSQSQVIVVTASTDKGSILGESGVTVPAGESRSVPLTIRALSTTSATSYSGSVKACSGNQFVASACDEKTFVVSVAPEAALPTATGTATPSGASGACLPFLQRSASVPVGGFNLLFWNIGGTQVAKCEWDYVGIAFLLVLALVGYLLVSGKIEPMDLLSPSAIVAVVAGAVAYFLITAVLGSFANLNMIFAFGAGLLGFVYSRKGGI